MSQPNNKPPVKETLTKAEAIEKLCNRVLDKEKANRRYVEILIKRTEVQIKIKKRIIGYVVERKGTYVFQYSIC